MFPFCSLAVTSGLLIITLCSFAFCSILLLVVCSIIVFTFPPILLLTSFFSYVFSWESLSFPFFLGNYTDNIEGNVHKVFKICSSLFRIHCTSFWLFMKTITMFSCVLVYVTYLLYLRFLYFHHLFHITGGHILCCTCKFIR